MKISRYFRPFLERNGYLQLPAIGNFEVVKQDHSGTESGTNTRRMVRFSGNPSPAVDISLVKFLCEQIKSEACVVQSDIISFTTSIKELLMQGLEAEIPGIGYLNITQQNQLLFSLHSRYHQIPEKMIKKSSPAIFSFFSFWL